MYSVIVPTFNEEAAIKDTLDEIITTFHQHQITSYEIIVVNDGSTDNTSQCLDNYPIKVINNPHNIGYGHSLKTGIQHAKYDHIIITDADFSYSFKDVPNLIKSYEAGSDMIVGARQGKHYKESRLKAPLRIILKFIVEFSTGRKIPDINSGLRIFDKKTALKYQNHLCNTFSFTTSITLTYFLTGKFVQYVPISYRQRRGKTKVKLLKDSFKTLQYIIQTINYFNPMKLFLLFFMICLSCSTISFGIGLFTHLNTFYALGIGSTLIALLSLGLGLLADLLSQIMQTSK